VGSMGEAAPGDMDWDLSSYFPSFGGEEMRRFKETLGTDLARLRERAAALPPLNTGTTAQWVEVLTENEAISPRLSHLNSYVNCLAAADTRVEAYLQEQAAMALLNAESAKLRVDLIKAFKESSDDAFTSLLDSPAMKGAEHHLRRLREESKHRMNREEEVLAADLAVNGLQAWGRLYDTLSGKLEFDMVYPDGRRQHLPISQRRSLMESPDRSVRKAAFEGGNAAWQGVADTVAAALNAISGTRLILNRRRGVNHFLDVALFQSGIGRKTLDAMFEALDSQLDLPRRILRLKARTMGVPAVAWYDLGAPLPLANREELPWEKATALVRASFTQAYPALGEFVGKILERRWIDWQPRPGKQPGGFCTGSQLIRESRIFMTYNKTLGDLLTLAHETGHAFHSHVMRDLRPYARRAPMTLAETASTFGEMILIDGLLKDPQITPAQKALMLDIETGHGAIYLLDIPVRYEFEKKLYQERARGEISVSRLKDMMVETQRKVLGNVLEEGTEDPYFWASKLHFYITGVTFYNFPYTFGYLLSRGLFAILATQGAAFLPRYEEFLRLTGSDTPENIARRTLGRDLESSEFWVEAIRSLEEPLKQLEALAPGVLPPAGDSARA